MKKQETKEKIRVYEYAKSLNMSSKEIITILKRLDIPVNNHMSVMEPGAVEAVEKFFHDIKSNAAAKRSGQATSTSPAATERPRAASNNDKTAEQRAKEKTSRGSGNSADNATSGKVTSSERGTAVGSSAGQQRGPQRNQRKNTQDRNTQEHGNAAAQSTSKSNQSNQSGDRNRMNGQKQDQQKRQQGGGQQNEQRRSNQTDRSKDNNRTGGQRNQSQGNQQSTPTNRPPHLRTGVTATKEDFDETRGTQADVNTKTKRTKSNAKRFDDNKVSNMRGSQNVKAGGRHQGKGRGRTHQQAADAPRKEKVDNTPKKIIVRGTMTTGELAKLLHKDVSEVIKKLLFLGAMVTINQEIDLDTIMLVAADYGIEVELKIPVEEDKFELVEEKDDEVDLEERPPVVTIMGHVDHGKTTLLDSIRHTKVSEGEAGGITQHIGAYQVEVNGKKITFLDTPGHEAFTTMRSRGAQVTDITILVVAADDGVMPQTVEAINHAKAANVPIIVAVNKIDKPEANPDRIKQELTEYELVPEEWGGDTIYVNISAKQRTGLDELLEMILLVSEVQEIKANPNKRARGTVLEAELDKGRGPVARVLIQHGTLSVGDALVAGVSFGRVRTMVNDKGKRIKDAGPSTPVEITGLTEVPQAGDPFIIFEDERKARSIAEKRTVAFRQNELGANSLVTLDDLYKHIQEGEIKDLNLILKADVQGTAEALKGSLEKIEVEGVRVKILHTGAGAITESDISLASASNAIIVGFNVRPEPAAKTTADQEKVDIRLYSVIYHAIDEIESAMKGLLDPVYKEEVVGHAEVRNLFKVSRIGTIAGCMVTSGKILRTAKARIVRNGVVIYEGSIDTLKRFKDDAREVTQGFECGITLENFNDIKEGDIIEAFVMERVER